MNTSSSTRLPPPSAAAAMQFEPIPAPLTPATIIENLLRRPGRIIHELHHARAVAVAALLLLVALACLATYGLVVGSLTGGLQLLVAPAKIGLGTLLAMLICLPSLYIFLALNGIDAPLRTASGALFATVCLGGLLLIGLAPVAWIFSQSTDSVALLGTLHLLFWLVGLAFGLRMLRALSRFGGASPHGPLRTWTIVFLIVSLQMATTLRPIVAHSDKFLPAEKKFFLSYWGEVLRGDPAANR